MLLYVQALVVYDDEEEDADEEDDNATRMQATGSSPTSTPGPP